jgi:NAD-dependent SIR2 family protein deacetylase
MLDPGNLEYSRRVATEADVCIVVGTSMQVSPANLIPFTTKEDCLIYYVDPSDIDFKVSDYRMAFFYHIKEKATTGMQKVYDDLIKIYKNA